MFKMGLVKLINKSVSVSNLMVFGAGLALGVGFEIGEPDTISTNLLETALWGVGMGFTMKYVPKIFKFKEQSSNKFIIKTSLFGSAGYLAGQSLAMACYYLSNMG